MCNNISKIHFDNYMTIHSDKNILNILKNKINDFSMKSPLASYGLNSWVNMKSIQGQK